MYTETVPPQSMEINFENIEPIVDTTNADILTVNGNGAANSIAVVQDPNAATRALVSVDGFETMSFANKSTLLVNAFGGDDVVNVAIATTAVIAALTAIRINGDQGNDTIRLESVPTAVTSIVVNSTAASANPLIPASPFAGDGNDTIDGTTIAATTAPTIFGGAGNDNITGGLGNDTIDAGTGDDTLIDSPAADIYNGGGGNDTLVIRGTIINDILSALSWPRTRARGTNYELSVINGPLAAPPAAVIDQITTTNAALSPANAANRPTIERILIEALDGDDDIAVGHNDQYSDLSNTNGVAAQTIPIHVVGDRQTPAIARRADEGLGDLVIHREGPDGRSGSIVVGGMAPVSYESPNASISFRSTTGQTGTRSLRSPDRVQGRRLRDQRVDDQRHAAGAGPIFIGQRNIDPGRPSTPPPFADIPRRRRLV